MNIIHSVTGINMNLNSGWNMGGNFNNNQNINMQGNYNYNVENDDIEDDGDVENEEEENEEEDNYEEILYNKKRNKFIIELDEFQYKHVKKYSTIKEDKCAICLQKYKGVDIIKEFPCRHIFHKTCILKWIKSSNKCPLCKYDIADDVNKVELRNNNDFEEDEEEDN